MVKTDPAGGDHSFYLTGEYVALDPQRRIEHVERMHLPEVTPDAHVVTEFSARPHGTHMKMRIRAPDLATGSGMVVTGMTDRMAASCLRLDEIA